MSRCASACGQAQHVRAQRRHRRRELPAAPGLQEPVQLLLDDRLGLGRLVLALVAVLARPPSADRRCRPGRRRPAIPHLGLDVARHGDVEQEQRPAAARPLHLPEQVQRQHRPLRARRRDDDVRRRRARAGRSLQSATAAPNRAASSSARARVRLVTVSVAPCVRSVRAASSDILPAPTTSTRAPVEVAEHLARELDRHRADRDRVARDRGLAAHAARHPERALEAGVEDAPGRPCADGGLVRLLRLPQDLRLAHHQRIEAGGDAKQVPDRLGVAPFVKVRGELGDGHAGAPRQRLAQRLRGAVAVVVDAT